MADISLIKKTTKQTTNKSVASIPTSQIAAAWEVMETFYWKKY